MADARIEPQNESPAQRRERLLNLNNPDWQPSWEQPEPAPEQPEQPEQLEAPEPPRKQPQDK